MSIKFNGTNLKSANFNSTSVDKILFDNNIVWKRFNPITLRSRVKKSYTIGSDPAYDTLYPTGSAPRILLPDNAQSNFIYLLPTNIPDTINTANALVLNTNSLDFFSGKKLTNNAGMTLNFSGSGNLRNISTIKYITPGTLNTAYLLFASEFISSSVGYRIHIFYLNNEKIYHGSTDVLQFYTDNTNGVYPVIINNNLFLVSGSGAHIYSATLSKAGNIWTLTNITEITTDISDTALLYNGGYSADTTYLYLMGRRKNANGSITATGNDLLILNNDFTVKESREYAGEIEGVATPSRLAGSSYDLLKTAYKDGIYYGLAELMTGSGTDRHFNISVIASNGKYDLAYSTSIETPVNITAHGFLKAADLNDKHELYVIEPYIGTDNTTWNFECFSFTTNI